MLCCGGFEFDFEMQKQFLPGWPDLRTGHARQYRRRHPHGPAGRRRPLAHEQSPGRTGRDRRAGVRSGRHPDQPVGRLHPRRQVGQALHGPKPASRHGFGEKEFLLYFDGVTGDFTRLPCYAIFDEIGSHEGPLVSIDGSSAGSGWFSGYDWSKDNSKEIEKGWIIKGETLAELATKLGMKAADLEATITGYNENCKKEVDPDFARRSEQPGRSRAAALLRGEALPDHVQHAGRPATQQQVPGRGPVWSADPAAVFGGRAGFVLGLDVQRRRQQRRMPLHGTNRRPPSRRHEVPGLNRPAYKENRPGATVPPGRRSVRLTVTARRGQSTWSCLRAISV